MATLLYAGLLGLLYLGMTFRVIRGRYRHKISLGVGEQGELLTVVSAHNNFSNYAFILILFLFLFETIVQASLVYVHLLGFCFVLGRAFHFYAVCSEKMNFKLRRAGMMMTLAPLLIMSLIFIISFFKTLI